ncbi:guanine nucleotide-binding protein G(I)/G(S)/G(O) subunit gamma-T2 isoform X2 [Pezoporus occidentalis]|uniref:guanine nucleotide-binding protein G(I)/G(S)/G(O) subunit gamma-T2 isoform X2 n=1 Tax=Pezoporus occidentalis TaxID=407982 RepID=UPI002F91918F
MAQDMTEKELLKMELDQLKKEVKNERQMWSEAVCGKKKETKPRRKNNLAGRATEPTSIQNPNSTSKPTNCLTRGDKARTRTRGGKEEREGEKRNQLKRGETNCQHRKAQLSFGIASSCIGAAAGRSSTFGCTRPVDEEWVLPVMQHPQCSSIPASRCHQPHQATGKRRKTILLPAIPTAKARLGAGWGSGEDGGALLWKYCYGRRK